MAEDNHPLVLFGQRVNRLLDQPGALALNDRFVGLIGRIGKLETVVALLEPDRLVDREGLKLLLPDVIDGAVGGNLVKPGRERIRFVKILQGRESLDEGFLRQIFDLLPDVDDPVDEIENRIVILLE